MMGVQEQAAIICDGAAGCLASGVGVASRCSRLIIHPRDESLHCLHDAVCPAECAYDTPFCRGVLLLGQPAPLHCLRSWHLGPLGDVLPVPIHPQQPVQAAERLVIYLIYVLTVAAAAWPVHEPVRLKRSRVAKFNSQKGCQFSCCWLILVRRCCPVHRYDDTQPRGIPTVFPGAVHGRGAPQPSHAPQDIVRLPRGNIVQVQCEQVPALHMVLLSAVFPKSTAYESAYVLKFILLRFRKSKVLLQCLVAPYRSAELFCKLGPHDGASRPLYCLTASCCAYMQHPVILHPAPS